VLICACRENILKTAKALVEDTKTLVAGAASNQEQLAGAAQNAVMTITRLADCVKHGAASLGSEQPEAQVIAAVADIGEWINEWVDEWRLNEFSVQYYSSHKPGLCQMTVQKYTIQYKISKTLHKMSDNKFLVAIWWKIEWFDPCYKNAFSVSCLSHPVYTCCIVYYIVYYISASSCFCARYCWSMQWRTWLQRSVIWFLLLRTLPASHHTTPRWPASKTLQRFLLLSIRFWSVIYQSVLGEYHDSMIFYDTSI